MAQSQSQQWTVRKPDGEELAFESKSEAQEAMQTAEEFGESVELIAPAELPAEPTNTEDFVTEVAGVPEVFVLQMGQGAQKRPFVTKEGLTYLAAQAGYEIEAEPIKPAWDDNDPVVWKGIVRDPKTGREWTDYGTAHPDQETLGSQHMDELCSSRATNRALRLATGCGMTSLEEVHSEEAVDVKEPVDVDAEISDAEGGV